MSSVVVGHQGSLVVGAGRSGSRPERQRAAKPPDLRMWPTGSRASMAYSWCGATTREGRPGIRPPLGALYGAGAATELLSTAGRASSVPATRVQHYRRRFL